MGLYKKNQDGESLVAGKGKSVVNHNDLIGRDAINSHPMSAITGLVELSETTIIKTNTVKTNIHNTNDMIGLASDMVNVEIDISDSFGDKVIVASAENHLPMQLSKLNNNGISYSLTDNGKILVNGKATANSYSRINSTKEDISLFGLIPGDNLLICPFSNQDVPDTFFLTIESYNDTTRLNRTVVYFNNKYNFTIPLNTNRMVVTLEIRDLVNTYVNLELYLAVTKASEIIKETTVTESNFDLDVSDLTTINTSPYNSIVNYISDTKTYIDENSGKGIEKSLTYITPESFGAVGDGIHDDTEALQNCIDAANESKTQINALKTYKTSGIINLSQQGMIININRLISTNTDVAIAVTGNHNTINIQHMDCYGGGFRFEHTESDHTYCNKINVHTMILTHSTSRSGIEFVFKNTSVARYIYDNIITFCYMRGNYQNYAFYGAQKPAGLTADNTIQSNHITGNLLYGFKWIIYGRFTGCTFKDFDMETTSQQQNGFCFINGRLNYVAPNRCTEFLGKRNQYGILIKQEEDSGQNEYVIHGNVPLNVIVRPDFKDSREERHYFDELSTVKATTIVDSQYYSQYMGESITFRGENVYVSNPRPYSVSVETETYNAGILNTLGIGGEIELLGSQNVKLIETCFEIRHENCIINLSNQYCEFGVRSFLVDQRYGNVCKIYDKNNEVVFDGEIYGNGIFEVECETYYRYLRHDIYRDPIWYVHGSLPL